MTLDAKERFVAAATELDVQGWTRTAIYTLIRERVPEGPWLARRIEASIRDIQVFMGQMAGRPLDELCERFSVPAGPPGNMLMHGAFEIRQALGKKKAQHENRFGDLTSPKYYRWIAERGDKAIAALQAKLDRLAEQANAPRGDLSDDATTSAPPAEERFVESANELYEQGEGRDALRDLLRWRLPVSDHERRRILTSMKDIRVALALLAGQPFDDIRRFHHLPNMNPYAALNRGINKIYTTLSLIPEHYGPQVRALPTEVARAHLTRIGNAAIALLDRRLTDPRARFLLHTINVEIPDVDYR